MIKKSFQILLLMLFYGLTNFISTQAQFIYSVTDTLADFTVSFQKPPRLLIEDPSTKNNYNRVTGFIHEDKDRLATYYAVATILDVNNIPDIVPSEYLNLLADNYHEKWGAHESSKAKVAINGNSGWEIDLKVNEKYNLRANIFYFNGIIYELIIVTTPEELSKPINNDFFQSFSVILDR